MRATLIFVLLISFAAPAYAEDAAPPSWWDQKIHTSASIGISTSGTINGEINRKPRLSLNLSGNKGRMTFGARHETADSYSGTDSENRFHVAWRQDNKLANLNYQVMYKTYPGTRPGLTDEALLYQVSASRSLKGINYGLGLEYTNADYATTRKSYGLNLSVSRSFLPKLSGWLSVSHKKQWGSVDYTNANIGLYYQATPKIGVATSINNWHAYADWAVDRPTLSVSLSRRL
ncbi:hypothetical protein ABAC460_21690 [Asticcacaulis sp. AC460]|uniref:hypothetical protein n=1 Tax=Asticcacaulis sp. AC460 TaxID=1282360 RepID=UPI0003C3C933|nr:hypothetical protein [Asticcacaulis sp. AC460]ESQ86996.1 hypothetical protein ABAC460_21690 [Asticcacaulis sp. AC460]